MTQKEKIQTAMRAAMRIKSITTSLEYDAKSYDCTWPNSHIYDLKRIVDDLLKVL